MNMPVSRLMISEPVSIHTEPIQLLQSNLGQQASQDIIERAIVEVAGRIGVIEQSQHLGDFEKLRKTARGLSAISEQLGLRVLAKVAQDAVICAGRQDQNALAAVIQRLIRVGDGSLAATIDGAVPPV